MSCEECRLMLDECVEDELDEKRAAQALSHINACAECTYYYEDLKRERQIYFRYFTSLDATPALWSGVRVGIEEIDRNRVSIDPRHREPRRAAFGVSSFSPAYGVVALALLTALGVLIGAIKYRSAEIKPHPEIAFQKADVPPIKSLPRERDATAVVKTPDKSKPVKRSTQNTFSGNARKPTPVAAVKKAEQQYLNALAVLSRDMKRQRTRPSPDVASEFKKSLAEVDRTNNATRQAVREQPGDVAAVQHMSAAFSKKIELLRDLASR